MITALERASVKRTGRELVGRGGVVLTISVLVNWLVLVAVLETAIVGNYGHLQIAPVTWWTTVGAVGSVVAYGVIDARSDTPDRTFAVVATVVLLLSFVPDLALLVHDSAATVGATGVLMVMHVTVAATSVAILTDYPVAK